MPKIMEQCLHISEENCFSSYTSTAIPSIKYKKRKEKTKRQKRLRNSASLFLMFSFLRNVIENILHKKRRVNRKTGSLEI